MPDFRTPFYDRYVSKFKRESSQLDDRILSARFAWSQYRFLPLLEGLGSGASILELGCGPGYMLTFLMKWGFAKVKGIDISKEQIDLALARGAVADVANVFEYLKAKAGTYDAIIALDFVEHFHKEELSVLLPLIYDSLNKGGKLILQTPNGEGLFPRQVIYGDLTHVTIFTPNSLRQLLDIAGFQNFRFSETGPVPTNAKGKIRCSLWTVIKHMANSVRRIETGKSQVIWTENMICYAERAK